MATSSALPLIIDTLVTRMQADPRFADIEVIDGLGRDDEPLTVIAIGDTDSWERDFAGLPTIQIDERFDINFWIRVREHGMQEREARDRAFELLGYMDQLFVVEINLRNEIEQLHTIALKPTRFIEIPTDEGPNAYISGVISCKTRFKPEDIAP